MYGSRVKGRRFSVIGGARSGRAVARLLKEKGAEVFLSEAAPEAKMAETANELRRLGIEAEYGGNSEAVLHAEVVVLSPGVPSTVPIVQQAVSRGLPVVSELEVASWFSKGKIVGVTGTNGKTTTTTLIGEIFRDAGKAHLVGGNIGTAFSDIVQGLDESGTAILEVSSFQLDHIERFSPDICVILNITPDHLDRYGGSYDRYVASKSRIFEKQVQGDYIVYNHEDEAVRLTVQKNAGQQIKKLPFARQGSGEGAMVQDDMIVTLIEGERTEIVGVSELKIRGDHNLQNAMASILVASASGIEPESVRETLRTFEGVEHRLEAVRELNDVLFVNDSKATNVEAVWHALRSFDRPIILLLGGRDKGNDYSRIEELVRQNVKLVVALGESAGKVSGSFSSLTKVVEAQSMEDAVTLATEAAEKKDIVLLSPACASFDWFENYEQRGRVFKEIVLGL